MEFKCNLKYVLLDLGMDQTELADAAGLNRSMVSAIANGRSLKIETALKIAKTLNVPVERIWELSEA
jgi:DNA-binding XRE family transcriptional regulator